MKSCNVNLGGDIRTTKTNADRNSARDARTAKLSMRSRLTTTLRLAMLIIEPCRLLRKCQLHVTFAQTNNPRLLYHPVMSSHFLHSLGNYARRAIFPEACKINQSINQSSIVLSVDCLIDDKSILTWLVYWIRTARSVFYRGGAKVTQHNGTMQYHYGKQLTFQENVSAPKQHQISYELHGIKLNSVLLSSYFKEKIQIKQSGKRAVGNVTGIRHCVTFHDYGTKCMGYNGRCCKNKICTKLWWK